MHTPESKVYPALRLIGYNIRYHNLKCNNPDPLYDIGKLVRECVLTAKVPLIEHATKATDIFVGVNTRKYRISENDISISMMDANYAGIKVSELNMYNVFEGINTLILNEPYYNNVRNDRLVSEPMILFDDIKVKLVIRYNELKATLSYI